jgi:hypothetical protein
MSGPYKMNKNVWHDKEHFPKGAPLDAGHKAFSHLMKSGHVDDFGKVEASKEVEAKSEEKKPARK